MPGQLFIISAPSGAGKSSLVKALLHKNTDIRLSISHTTRAPRPGEKDGREYHFVSREAFLSMQSRDEFLESAEVYGNLYGTSRPWIESQRSAGQDILLEIDWQGAARVRERVPDTVSIFILPPSLDSLRHRLEGRGQDSSEVIEKRLGAALSDIAHASEFDFLLVNDDFETAVSDLACICRASRMHRISNPHADLLGALR
jgi:guanylate kinase